jgi:D-alanine-D-alanine ligase
MITVAVLRGGPSDEYDISLKTGATVLSNLQREPYRAIDVFIDKAGVWHVRGIPVSPERALSMTDVAWNALHGRYGEDGTVQRVLDRLGVPYTGSGALGSALAMNKVMAKEILARHGIRMARSTTLTVSAGLEREVVELFRTFPQPSVVKPAASGSSVGVTLARSFTEFTDGITAAFQRSTQVIVEEFIKGRQATVGVIDALRGQARYALPALETELSRDMAIFDYETKGGTFSVRCPGNFSRQESEELMRMATHAHNALGLRHYSRSDFIVSPKGAYFLEANSLPGLTDTSSLTNALKAVGVSMPEFIDHVIALARG